MSECGWLVFIILREFGMVRTERMEILDACLPAVVSTSNEGWKDIDGNG